MEPLRVGPRLTHRAIIPRYYRAFMMMSTLQVLRALTLAFCLGAPLAWAQGPVTTDLQDESDIVVRAEKNGEKIVINAEMPVHASVTAVWDVLTDYDHMAQFVANVSSSRIT